MLWTLLTAVSSVTVVAGSVIAAIHAKAGFTGYAVAMSIGFGLGACNAWTLHRLSTAMDALSKQYSEVRREWCFRALYVALVAWVPFAIALGDWLTSMALRLII